MICFLVARGYEFTLKPVLSDPAAPRISTLLYDETLGKRALANATYIFSDVDRLSVEDLTRAARLYRRLQEGGCRVLNDPATVRKRFALLRGLYLAGLNPNNVHLADEGWSKVRFPVFIRVADGHDGPLTDLIADQAELETALDAAVVAGIPRSTIVIVEYAAEPIRPGIYRKSAIHRVGERLITTINWHTSDWRVKGDQIGLADEVLLDEELSTVRENRHASQASKVFDFANIEYGRMDFGVVGGRVCVYEINTNPTIFGPGEHSIPQRVESSRLRWARYLEALHAIDTEEDSAKIDVRGLSVQSWDRASKLYPALRVPRQQLSKEQRRRGNFELALRYAEEIVAASPSGMAFARVATLLDRLGRTEVALTAVRRAMELAPQEGGHAVLLATILLKAGRYAEARDCLQQATVDAKANSNRYLLLSEACLKLGDFRGAWHATARAAELTAKLPKDRRDAFLMKAMWRLARLRSRLAPR
jgi:tetratricopeptide (TPR) repeat protein